MKRRIVGWTTIAIAAMAGASDGSAQDPFAWENATELSFVSTSGNASSSTLGLKSGFTGTGGANELKFEFGGIRGETSFTTREASGTAGSFTVTEVNESRLTAENYFVRSRYDRAFEAAYTFAGAGWDRNTFSGIANRYAVVTGVGKAFTDTDEARFKTDIGVTYTIQKDVDPAPGADDAFAGLRISIDAMRQLTPSTQYISALLVDENLEQTDDFRADWVNSLSVSLSESLAFKTSLQLLFDNMPSLLGGIPLFAPGGTPTGSTVSTPGDKVDSVLTVALVITL